jgi:type IV secretion system protein VirB10
MLAKVLFVVAVIAVVAVGALMGFNKWRAKSKADQAQAEQVSKGENKPAAVGTRRSFDTDPPPLPSGAQPKAKDGWDATPAGGNGDGTTTAAGPQACADGMPGVVMIGQDGKPLMSPGGVPMRVCKDGRVLVPAVQGGAGAQPIPLAGGQGQNQRQGQTGNQPPSRYAGDVLTTSSNPLTGGQPGQQLNPNDPMTTVAMVQAILGQNQQRGQAGAGAGFGGQPQGQGSPAPGGGQGGQQPPAANPPGSLGSLLTPSQTPMVQAGMLGDRNMILPKGRTIDCGMSMRLVNEVAGMASCVLSQNVYSDNGRVLLLERGSEATGEYVAAMAQGQRRLFVLWTRIKTPAGVIINLNSPAADGLGTSGMDGYIDNHWWERLGAAFLLSMVQDAIAYKTAQAGNGSAGGSVVYQNTAQTGNRMAEKVLDSTINIKPTLYKNQGDRGSIYVARDLDFGSVYALRAR